MKKCNKCLCVKVASAMTKGRGGKVAPLCLSCKSEMKQNLKLRKLEGSYESPHTVEYRFKKFLKDALLVHGELYSYERVVYVNAHTDVEIFCTRHQGYFTTTPTSHTSGTHCSICARVDSAAKRKYTKEEYIELAISVWGDAYDYSEINYVDCFTEIKIRCPVHGLVGVVPTQHLSGRGCKECAKNGYNIAKPGHLYILANGDMTKVGITNTTPEARCKVLSRKHENQFEVIHSAYWEDGNIANDIETLLLRNLKVEYDNPDDRFHGWTETFLNVDRDKLINQLKELSHDYN